VGFLAAGVGRIAPGIELIGELIGLDAAMSGSDLVIVGEGSLDDQSLEGKAPIAVARPQCVGAFPSLPSVASFRPKHDHASTSTGSVRLNASGI
jgi:glycerate kinase